MKARELTKPARNEGRKLKATSLNTVGLTVFGLGALQPVFSANPADDDLLKVALSSAILAILHAAARASVADLED